MEQSQLEEKKEKLKQLISDYFKIEKGSITQDIILKGKEGGETLGLDDGDFLLLLVKVEKEFCISIEWKEQEGIETFDNLLSLIVSKTWLP